MKMDVLSSQNVSCPIQVRKRSIHVSMQKMLYDAFHMHRIILHKVMLIDPDDFKFMFLLGRASSGYNSCCDGECLQKLSISVVPIFS